MREFLKKQNFIITLEGDFDAEYMGGDEACVDKQYAAMAEKSLSPPAKLDLTEEMSKNFEKRFGVSWESAVSSHQVMGVAEAEEHLDLSGTVLSDVWLEIVMNDSSKCMKLERNVYCCLVDSLPEKSPFFCINGFYPGMRAEYSAPSSSLHYFLVEWSSTMLDWATFRSSVIGACHPLEADPLSLRGAVAKQWRELRLQRPPDLMHNAIHASASAFEACVERSIWFKTPLEEDAMFGQKLISAGIPLTTLKDWSANPKIFDKNVFDYMLNLDSAQCVAKAIVLLKRSNPGVIHMFFLICFGVRHAVLCAHFFSRTVFD